MPSWFNHLFGRVAAASLRDLEHNEALAAEVYDAPVKIEDQPGGRSGEIDPGDRFVSGSPSNPLIERLGAERTEDLAFRAAVVQASKDLSKRGHRSPQTPSKTRSTKPCGRWGMAARCRSANGSATEKLASPASPCETSLRMGQRTALNAPRR